jgi:hypothetical protein
MLAPEVMKTTRSFLPRALVPLALAALAFLVTGCVGVVPFPVSSTKVETGHRITPADMAFIQPGQTTRSQVVARLGRDFAALPCQRAIAYSWEMQGGGGVYWAAIAGPGGGGAASGGWVGGWKGFFVAFDGRSVVQAVGFKDLSTKRSLHANLERWVAKLPAAGPLAAEVAKQ